MLQHIAHLFYEPDMKPSGLTILNEEESGHIIRVLRMRVGDRLHTTDGHGNLFQAEIAELQKRNVVLHMLENQQFAPSPNPGIHIAIAPLKHMDRFEWFLEKAVEIGVSSITPIRTKRTERSIIKPERMQKMMVAAMKQSQRMYLPTLGPLTDFSAYLPIVASSDSVKLIGWCAEETAIQKPQPQSAKPVYLLIGPEGDFTPDEATQAKAAGFVPISLGDYRLRTETAAIVALTLLQN